MDITVEGHVGSIITADGANQEIRLSRDGSVVVTQSHSEFFEVASRNQLYTGCTAVGGVAHGTAFGATPAIALACPINNPMALVVNQAHFGYLSGTLGLGTWTWGQQAGVAATGFVTTVQQGRIYGNQLKGASTGLFYSATNLTNTATILRPSLSYGAFAGGAAMLTLLRDDVRGEFIVMPGATLVLQGVGTAGTSPLFIVALDWYEVPVAQVS